MTTNNNNTTTGTKAMTTAAHSIKHTVLDRIMYAL